MEGSLDVTMSRPGSDLPISFWEKLSHKEKVEFIEIRKRFHQNQKTSTKDRRSISFSDEIQMVLNFTEDSDISRENKSILIGIAFAGSFICVNTRQLKNFLGRCKSSINGSFQQMGYVAVKTKSKARSCILSVMPSLSTENYLLRQWSVRYASDGAKISFTPKFIPESLPTITNEDLFEEKKPNVGIASVFSPSSPLFNPSSSNSPTKRLNRINNNVKTVKFSKPINGTVVDNRESGIVHGVSKSKAFDFEIPTSDELGFYEASNTPEITPSFSCDFTDYIISELAYDIDGGFESSSFDNHGLTRSKSSFSLTSDTYDVSLVR